MDGFESNDGAILVAATNRPDVLDPALLRPGRVDRRVIVDRPDIRGREEVLRVLSKKVPMEEDVNLNILARETPGVPWVSVGAVTSWAVARRVSAVPIWRTW